MRKKLSICQYEIIHTISIVLGLICVGIAINTKQIFVLSLVLSALGVVLSTISVVIQFNRDKVECADELSESNERKASNLLVQIIAISLSFLGVYCVITNKTISFSPSIILYLGAFLHTFKLGAFIMFEKKSSYND